ncbi:MAG: hypothetical protein HY360_12855 [Verrucomicrobia bacterium]|nr:hypothetical protein [Verrucomicrobiota bacterium]
MKEESRGLTRKRNPMDEMFPESASVTAFGFFTGDEFIEPECPPDGQPNIFEREAEHLFVFCVAPENTLRIGQQGALFHEQLGLVVGLLHPGEFIAELENAG